MSIIEFTDKNLEKWMRRIECRKLWGKYIIVLSVDQMISLSNALMTYASNTRDYRFLNAALKLNDKLYDVLDNDSKIKLLKKNEYDAIEDLKKYLSIL